ncbi:hypothetical protein PENTCL1PPCAC_18226, partial [Pristionchus entomophagus]
LSCFPFTVTSPLTNDSVIFVILLLSERESHSRSDLKSCGHWGVIERDSTSRDTHICNWSVDSSTTIPSSISSIDSLSRGSFPLTRYQRQP